MQELLLIIQVEWKFGAQMLEASPKIPSQEPNEQEESSKNYTKIRLTGYIIY